MSPLCHVVQGSGRKEERTSLQNTGVWVLLLFDLLTLGVIPEFFRVVTFLLPISPQGLKRAMFAPCLELNVFR